MGERFNGCASWKEARREYIPNRAWEEGLTAAQAPAGRPNQSPGCVALQGRPNPGWSNTNSIKPCRGDPHPKCVSYQYRAIACRSARRVALAGLFVFNSLRYPGFGRPCRATHPGLWRDRPYRGFAPLSTSWKEARREYLPSRAWEKGLTAVPAGERGRSYAPRICFIVLPLAAPLGGSPLQGSLFFNSLRYPGFGCPCRATHPGLWRDRPYRGFAPLSTSWKEARWSTSPTALGRKA